MKLLLDMYRSAPKEQRDKVQLMAAEKKSKSEVINTAHSPTHRLLHTSEHGKCSEAGSCMSGCYSLEFVSCGS